MRIYWTLVHFLSLCYPFSTLRWNSNHITTWENFSFRFSWKFPYKLFLIFFSFSYRLHFEMTLISVFCILKIAETVECWMFRLLHFLLETLCTLYDEAKVEKDLEITEDSGVTNSERLNPITRFYHLFIIIFRNHEEKRDVLEFLFEKHCTPVSCGMEIEENAARESSLLSPAASFIGVRDA